MLRAGYYQEESERKAMADQIKQMGIIIENHQKQFEELRAKFDAEVLKCSELSIKLDATEVRTVLASLQENALAHQACVLRADLEKSLKDNASLFSKIGREDKLNVDNRSVVDNYQIELTREIRTLCNTMDASISQQNEHLQCIEKFYFDVILLFSDFTKYYFTALFNGFRD
ncbi:hypothetical protein POM88_003613 [Heracleum sosnowskyi]|uniref:Uncharacterized protein n=1 Tax=Heracleum sosnowskyi TaxID=360622 RepID=A0AAD8JJ02_9APIA|nr:hypothetical protein POM88_003613 [Heracleum sosnowskyi]